MEKKLTSTYLKGKNLCFEENIIHKTSTLKNLLSINFSLTNKNYEIVKYDIMINIQTLTPLFIYEFIIILLFCLSVKKNSLLFYFCDVINSSLVRYGSFSQHGFKFFLASLFVFFTL